MNRLEELRLKHRIEQLKAELRKPKEYPCRLDLIRGQARQAGVNRVKNRSSNRKSYLLLGVTCFISAATG